MHIETVQTSATQQPVNKLMYIGHSSTDQTPAATKLDHFHS